MEKLPKESQKRHETSLNNYIVKTPTNVQLTNFCATASVNLNCSTVVGRFILSEVTVHKGSAEYPL